MSYLALARAALRVAIAAVVATTKRSSLRTQSFELEKNISALAFFRSQAFRCRHSRIAWLMAVLATLYGTRRGLPLRSCEATSRSFATRIRKMLGKKSI